MLCAPGTVYDDTLGSCNHESDVDTSQCNTWMCMFDGYTYPALYCNQVCKIQLYFCKL